MVARLAERREKEYIRLPIFKFLILDSNVEKTSKLYIIKQNKLNLALKMRNLKIFDISKFENFLFFKNFTTRIFYYNF